MFCRLMLETLHRCVLLPLAPPQGSLSCHAQRSHLWAHSNQSGPTQRVFHMLRQSTDRLWKKNRCFRWEMVGAFSLGLAVFFFFLHQYDEVPSFSRYLNELKTDSICSLAVNTFSIERWENALLWNPPIPLCNSILIIIPDLSVMLSLCLYFLCFLFY